MFLICCHNMFELHVYVHSVNGSLKQEEENIGRGIIHVFDIARKHTHTPSTPHRITREHVSKK